MLFSEAWAKSDQRWPGQHVHLQYSLQVLAGYKEALRWGDHWYISIPICYDGSNRACDVIIIQVPSKQFIWRHHASFFIPTNRSETYLMTKKICPIKRPLTLFSFHITFTFSRHLILIEHSKVMVKSRNPIWRMFTYNDAILTVITPILAERKRELVWTYYIVAICE